MTRLLGYRPPLTPHVLDCGSQVTRRWIRDGFDGYAPGMPGHLVATYYDREQACAWTHEGRALTARLRRGTITLIPEGRDGQWRLGGRTDVSQVYLTDQRLTDCAAMLEAPTPVVLANRLGFPDPAAARLVELLALDNVLAEPAAQLFVDRALDLLCLQLIARHSSANDVRPVASRGLADWQTKRISRYMQEHLDRPIRLQELAALVGLSRFHFCTAFRQATGLAPHAYLTRMRMLHACAHLQETALPIGEVAAAVGYASLSAFSVAFRRNMGVTPSAYRRAL
ncbi:MAG: AraC family transcriptional regulator [Phenylobacterium zucineum]|nr:MAG: AraC family transcriptional regulator [Phenylobacterium zucineum]